MRVVILNSPLFRETNPRYDEDSLPPIGLGYIGTHLQQNGFEVHLIDAVHERIALRDLIAFLNFLKPEVLASNIFTTNYELVKELFESITFSTHIIIGGLSTKGLYENIITWRMKNPVDVVIGDGELITLDLVNDNVKEEPKFSRGNFRVFKVDGSSAYFVENISGLKLNRKLFLNEPLRHPFGFNEAHIVASRGCIYNCTFCAAARSLNNDTPIRERSEESLVEELIEINKNYPGVDSIRVLDDLFLKNAKVVDKAIRVFSRFDVQWRSMAHVMTFKNVDQVTMENLKKSGCKELFIGIESGSPRILCSINKTHNIETIVENLTKVFKAKIDVKGYFIFGFPDETQEEMEMTFQLASRLSEIAIKEGSKFRTSVFQYRPYHGTEIFHDLAVDGKIAQVVQIAPNDGLSELVGRIQFNFHSGVYCNVDLETLHQYIYRTNNLNSPELFKGQPIHQPATKPNM